MHPAILCVALALFVVRAANADPLVPIQQRSWIPKTAATVDARHLRALTAGDSLLLVNSNHLGGDVRPILAVFDADLDERWNVNLADTRFRNLVNALEMASGDLLVAGTAAQSIIVQARGRQDGDLLWQHEYSAASTDPVAFALPAMAQNPVSGQIFVAVSDQGALWLKVVGPDGAAQPPIDLPTMGLHHAPNQLMVLAGGGLALTTIAGIDGPAAYQTTILDADGGVVGIDVEPGDIGHVDSPALALADSEGGLRVLGGPETACGLPESRLWRLAPDGKRLWTHIAAKDPCVSTTPIGLAAAPEEGILVGNRQPNSFGLQRIDADGALRWSRDWPGLPDGGSLVLRALAGNSVFQVLLAGEQTVAGGGGTRRPVAIILGADGDRCAEDALAASGSVAGVIAHGDRWLVVSKPNSAGPLTLSTYEAPVDCSVGRIFAHGFEEPNIPL